MFNDFRYPFFFLTSIIPERILIIVRVSVFHFNWESIDPRRGKEPRIRHPWSGRDSGQDLWDWYRAIIETTGKPRHWKSNRQSSGSNRCFAVMPSFTHIPSVVCRRSSIYVQRGELKFPRVELRVDAQVALFSSLFFLVSRFYLFKQDAFALL